jgi:formate dehydrogenase subunit gamma
LPALASAQALGGFVAGDAGPENTLGGASDSDIWRAIRQGGSGLPSASNLRPEDAVLVNAQGTWWSQLHQQQLISYSGLVLLGILGALALFFLVRRRIKIAGGRSGQTILRFDLAQRVIHWTMAALFLVMAFSGLILLFGRVAIVPYAGHTAFSVLASAAMQAHNLFGPIFAVATVALSFAFVRGNLPSLVDLKWILRAGGFFGGHASADRYNFGEKMWFWTAVIAGIALSVSGVLMLFPDALGTRDQLQFGNITHVIAAVAFIGFAFGHVYLGTVGTEGSLEGMVGGSVDKNWAITHHDIWAKRALSEDKDTPS